MSSDQPKPSKDTVYVDPDDDITTIIDKVENSAHKVVALVLPKRQSTLQSIVNMRLLKRSGDRASKNVVLITSEKALLPLAGAAGLHVAKNLQTAPSVPASPVDEKPAPPSTDLDADPSDAKLDYHRSIGELAAASAADDEAVTLDDEDEGRTAKAAPPPKDKKLKVPNFDRFRLGLGAGIAALILLIALIIWAFFIAPQATIAITTESTPVSANFQLTTSDKAPALDEGKKIIPAVLKTQDLNSTQTATATGTQNNGTKATGSVTIYNCTNNPVTVPTGNGISQNGLTYVTQSAVSLDSGNFDSHGNCKTSGSHVGTTNIVAAQGGSKYNANLSGATVSGFPNPGVTANGSASGGTDNNITVLSQSDVDNAKSKVTDQDKSNFSQSFVKGLAGPDVYVITSSLKAADPVVTANPAVGQPASNSTVSIKITYSVLTVKKSDLSKAITDQLDSQIDTSKQRVNGDVVQNASVTLQGQSSPTVATLQISEDADAIPIIDIQGLQKSVGGLKSADIQSKINALPGVKSVKVDLSPFWVSAAPHKTSKIHIKLLPSK